MVDILDVDMFSKCYSSHEHSKREEPLAHHFRETNQELHYRRLVLSLLVPYDGGDHRSNETAPQRSKTESQKRVYCSHGSEDTDEGDRHVHHLQPRKIFCLIVKDLDLDARGTWNDKKIAFPGKSLLQVTPPWQEYVF
jgi:hypothetical protein